MNSTSMRDNTSMNSTSMGSGILADRVDVSFCYDEAIRIEPDISFFYNSYGNFCLRIGKFEDAVAYFNIAIKKEPVCKAAIENLAKFYKIKEKEGKSVYIIDEARTNDIPIEEEPEISRMGFFNLEEMLGYEPFRISREFLRKSYDLKPYS